MNFKKEGIKDGDYVYGPDIEGVYYVMIHNFKELARGGDVGI